ncbi:MAG: hypothetical protein IJM35_09320 [Bacteroidales bacterium]|nr:hypothetical protein [Bacteroidales bacterium]
MKTSISLYVFFLGLVLCSCSRNDNTSGKEDGSNDPASNVCTFDLGYHRTVLFNDKATPDLYQPVLDGIKASGARVVRLSVTGGKEAEVMNHILYCNKIGLKVTLCINAAGLPANCYEEGTSRSKGNEQWLFYQVYPISKIVPEKFDNWISDLLLMYKDGGCKLDALEMGNEIMWGAFNADLPITGGIIYDSSYKWQDFPLSVREGIKRAGEISIIAKTACRKVYWEYPPKVVFGSLNISASTQYYATSGGCIVRPETVIKIATANYPGMPAGSIDYIKEIDGIAIHFYPDVPYSVTYENMLNGSLDYLKWIMDGMVEYTDKPVYVTEFGFPYTDDGIASDWKRSARFKAFLDAMDRTYDKYHWAQVFIYSWDQGKYAAINPDDGSVLDMGKTVIKNYYYRGL